MGFRGGILKRLKSNNTPNHLIFYDTETYILHLEGNKIYFPLRLGVAIYVRLDKHGNVSRRQVYHFYSTDEFIDILNTYDQKGHHTYVFAHNQGFDVRVLNLPNVFDDIGWRNEVPIINQMVFIWGVKGKKGKFTFLDTANYGVISVEQLGNDLGFDKLDIDFEKCTEDELMTYCERDVEILERFIITFINFLHSEELGGFRTTIGSQSLATFRTRFMKHDIVISNYPASLELERAAYHGGRVEARFIGELPKDDYYYLDVNSMYPYVMYKYEIPCENKLYLMDTTPIYLESVINHYYIIADVELNTDLPIYPYKISNKLVFPIGKFRAQLHHAEIEQALKYGHITYVHSVNLYYKAPLFKEYVEFFYQLKRQYSIEGNKTYRTITKLFLNSLYGKFAQMRVKRVISEVKADNLVIRAPTYDSANDMFYTYYNWYGTQMIEYKEGETNFSFPAISGAITAYARIVLWEYAVQAGLDNVFYMDTDSLIVDSIGYNNVKHILDENELGALKIETQSKLCTIHGLKDYQFGDIIRHKGVPRKAIQTHADIWKYLQFEGFISWLNKGAKGPMTAQWLTKTRTGLYNKGKVNQEGVVSPFVFPDDFSLFS